MNGKMKPTKDNRADQLERMAVIKAHAESVFGDVEKAQSWLTHRNLALGDTPLSMLATEAGAKEVTKALSAIATGGVV